MPSIHKHSSGRSPYWFAKFINEEGKTAVKSTEKTDRTEAMTICLSWQHAADLARNGRLTEARSRQIIGDILEKTTGEGIYDDTIEGYLTSWLKGKELAKSQGTHLRYGNTVKLFTEGLGKRKNSSITTVTPRDVERFRDTQLATGKASSTVNVDLKTLRTAFNMAQRRGLIQVNPVDVVEMPQEQRNKRGTFTAEQISQLLKIASDEWQTAIMLGYYVSMRLGDSISVAWENIDFEKGILKYRQQKTKKLMECPLHPDLEKYLLALPVKTRKANAILTPTLATKEIGGRNGLSREFKQLMEQARIDDGRIEAEASEVKDGKGKGRAFSTLSFHALRHTSISAMANAGVSEEIRMKISGHSNADAHNTYTHLELEPLKAGVSKLPSILLAPEKRPKP